MPKEEKTLLNKSLVKKQQGINGKTGKLLKGFKYIKGGDIVEIDGGSAIFNGLVANTKARKAREAQKAQEDREKLEKELANDEYLESLTTNLLNRINALKERLEDIPLLIEKEKTLLMKHIKETYKNDIKRFLSVSPTVYPKQIDTGINNTLDILNKVLTDKIHKLYSGKHNTLYLKKNSNDLENDINLLISLTNKENHDQVYKYVYETILETILEETTIIEIIDKVLEEFNKRYDNKLEYNFISDILLKKLNGKLIIKLVSLVSEYEMKNLYYENMNKMYNYLSPSTTGGKTKPPTKATGGKTKPPTKATGGKTKPPTKAIT